MLPRPSRIYDLPERFEIIVYLAIGSSGTQRLIYEDLSWLKKSPPWWAFSIPILLCCNSA